MLFSLGRFSLNLVGLSTIFSQRPQQIGENLLCESEFVAYPASVGRPVTHRAAALHIGHMLSRVAVTVGARGILKGRASGVELPRHSREGGHWPCTSRLSGALVLAAVQLESETRPPPSPRRQIHRTEGGWSCSTIWNYVLKGDDSTYLANFRCTRRQFDDSRWTAGWKPGRHTW